MVTRSLRSTAKREHTGGTSPITNHGEKANDQPPTKRAKTTKERQTTSTPTSTNHETIQQPDTAQPRTLKLTEKTGDIFAAPPNTLLIHACNCEGSWVAGIAKAFHDRYPHAYDAYAAHCDEHSHSLFGQAQLIPPRDDDGDSKHFVGCLFTSRSKGRKKDSPGRILGATRLAMEDLLSKVDEWNVKAGDVGEKVGEVRICQINSGLFAVPWVETKAVLESIDVSGFDVKEIKVVSRE